jgi:hypothetical protein
MTSAAKTVIASVALLAGVLALGSAPQCWASEDIESLARAAAAAVVNDADGDAAAASQADADGEPAAESGGSGEQAAGGSQQEQAPAPEKKAADPSAGAKRPEAQAVRPKDIKIEATLEGVFAGTGTEVALRPEAWTTFEVVELVRHGTPVRKGETLVRFDDEAYRKAVAAKALEQQVGEIALLQAEEQFPRLEKSADLNLQEAERGFQAARDEYQRFLDVMRPMSIRMAENSLKSSRQSLENAQEELTQLEKMYEADEITEETEEIVLKRQRFQVEMAKFSLEYAEVNYEYTIGVSIPRREESLQVAVEQARLALEQAQMAKSLCLSRQRFELEQMREARKKAAEEHAKLLADRDLFVLKAPCDGIAYYGRCVDGKWVDLATLDSKLIPHGAAPTNSVLMTIVAPRPLTIEATAAENQFAGLKEGLTAVVVPAADETTTLRARVSAVASVPGAGNKFRVALTLDPQEIPDWIAPGMACKATLTTYAAKQAVVVPADLIQTDADDPTKKYVLLAAAEGESPVRRDVRLGRKQDKDVEVVDGLSAGDKIVPPSDAS